MPTTKRDQLYFSVRYRTNAESAKWPINSQGRIMTDAAQLAEPVPRAFAEFPLTRNWQEIAIHARRLDGASHVGLFGDGDETWLRFVYMGQDFSIEDGGARLTLTVDDANCPDVILYEVQKHFVPLLSPEFAE
jgi:hypothetical protein